jgi:hypothetical protein
LPSRETPAGWLDGAVVVDVWLALIAVPDPPAATGLLAEVEFVLLALSLLSVAQAAKMSVAMIKREVRKSLIMHLRMMFEDLTLERRARTRLAHPLTATLMIGGMMRDKLALAFYSSLMTHHFILLSLSPVA